MSNFSTASRVLQAIRASDDIARVQGENRTKVLHAANCFPPLSEEDAKKNGIKINVDFGEFKETLAKATQQLTSAFMQNQFFFTVKLPLAPAEHRSDWEAFITQEINRPLRESLEYFELHRSRWTSVVSHGIAPMVWLCDDKWLPTFCPLSDLRIPTDTLVDFRNLKSWARMVPYTPFDLMTEAFNDKENNHWKKQLVANILKNYKQTNFTDASNNYDFYTDVEKFQSLMKQDGCYYGCDAMPTINLWHFYFEDLDEHGVKGWYMRVVPAGEVVKGTTADKFLWESNDPVARTWQELIHCQYGDLNADAPSKFAEVRGLGFTLLDPIFYSNLTTCRLMQHVHDNFNIWLRLSDNAEKARAQVQEFSNLGVLKQGVTVVPTNERHQIDSGVLEMALAQMKQLQVQKSSSYTQQADTGTQKEQTAFETRVKMEQVNAMMSGILMVAFKYESYADREICRRFCLKNSSDPDIIKFRNRCIDAGVPEQWLDVAHWEVEPVTPLGMGNPTIAQAAAQQLMALSPKMSPEAQQEVLHENVLVVTKDPRKAARLAPVSGKPMESDAKREAVGYFGTLMTGVAIPLSSSSLIDQIDALEPLLAGKITQITKRDNMASFDEGVGLQNVGAYLSQAIQQLGQDEQQKEKVKQYSDSLGKLMNEMKALVQRGVAARNKNNGDGNGHDSELQSKLKADQAVAAAKGRSVEAKAAQTIHHKELGFKSQQARDDARAAAEQRRQDAMAFATIQRERIKTVADTKNSRLKSVKAEE